MTDKVQKIREEVERLKEETSIGLSEHENGVEQGRMEIINSLSLFLDSMQEEPVSEDLEKVAYTYALKCQPLKTSYGETSPNPEVKDAVIYGANWQKQQTMKGAIDAKVGFRFHRLSIDLKDNGIECLGKGDKVKILILKQGEE